MILTTNEYIAIGALLAELALVAVLTPEFLSYRTVRRNILARIYLNVEILNPKKMAQPVYGFEDILEANRDLIDRVRNPQNYANLDAGNEILIVGPPLSGKKALAMCLARAAGIDRVIIVYNPRDAEVLAYAKRLIEKKLAGRTMLLMPGLNYVEDRRQRAESWPDLLEALIETASDKSNILPVGTTHSYDVKNPVATWFGTVLSLPQADSPAWERMMMKIANGFLDDLLKAKYVLAKDLSRDAFIHRVLEKSANPAEIKDIVALCQTTAIYNQKSGAASELVITPAILKTAVKRVVVEG